MEKRFKLNMSTLLSVLKEEKSSLIFVPIGTLCMCFSIAALVEPYKFASSGVTGIGLISNYVLGISPVWVITAGNMALLAWGWKAMSTRFALLTLYNTIIISIALPIFEMFEYPLIQNHILAALLAGCVNGLGIGILFREGGSSGGMDVVAAVAKKRWGVDVGSASFFVNLAVLAASLCAVDLERVLMGGLTLYVESVMIDYVVKSFDRRTQMMIISSRGEEIVDFILHSLERSATLISAKGAYRRTPVDMIMVILTRRQSVDLKRFVHSIDQRAFLIIGDVSEVTGEGFKKWE